MNKDFVSAVRILLDLTRITQFPFTLPSKLQVAVMYDEVLNSVFTAVGGVPKQSLGSRWNSQDKDCVS